MTSADKISAVKDDSYVMVLKDLLLKSGSNAIVRGVNMAVPKGKLVGILGESGAGKTTLLRLLARKLDESVLKIEGRGFLPEEIWYIAQEDVLYEYDTPRRAVMFLHQMLYDSATDDAHRIAGELLEKVQFIPALVDEHIGTLDDGGLSVGSRRLLQVALALCSQARMILLDEPTTGLDSATAFNLVKVVHDVCEANGISALCTIHQPSDEALGCFDDVIVMSEGEAYTVPNGLALSTQGGLHSMAELYLVEMKARHLKPSELPAEIDDSHLLLESQITDQLAKLENMHVVPIGRQVKYLMRRFWHRNWDNFFALRFRVLIGLGLAGMIGFCFWQLPYDDPRALRDHLGAGMAVIGTTFVPIVISAGFFPAEKPSLLNEMSQSKRFDIGPYLVCRTIFEMFVAILASPSMFIYGAMLGVQGRWARMWFTFVLQSFCSDAFGYMLSIRFPAEISIPALIPCVGFLSVIVGTGIAAPLKHDGGWIYHIVKWVSYFKYGFSGLVVDQFELMSGTCTPGLTERCTYPDAQTALKTLNFETEGFVGSYGFNWMMLLILFFVQRFASYLMLRGLVASTKYSYKAATNWDEKKAGDQARGADPGSEKAEPVDEEMTVVQVDPKPESEEQRPSSASPEPVEAANGSSPVGLVADPSFISHSALGGSFELQWRMEVVGRKQITPFTQGPETQLLHPQTGIASSGEVVGVLGPAGSGKTVLLKALSGQLPINGFVGEKSIVDVTCAFENDSHADPTVRFVYQNDSFVPGDTVTEAVQRQLALAMKEPADTWDASCKSILMAMGLSHVATKRADEISGGQLRRLSIACQLAHRPTVMLLDEPTSGLDSELALEAMEALRRFAAAANAVVICTLNQPGKRLLPTVDHFIFLRDGDCVFHGDLDSCCQYFEITPSEIVERSETDVILDRLRGDWTRSAPMESPQILTPQNKERNPHTVSMNHTLSAAPGGVGAFFSRIGILVKRNALSRFTSYKAQFIVELIVKFIAFPLIVGILFNQIQDDDTFYTNRAGVIFLLNCALGFVSFVTPIILYARERVVFDRETRAGDYHAMTYMLARWIFETPGELVASFIGSLIVFYIVGFQGNVGLFMVTNFLCYFASYGLGSALAIIPFSVSVNGGFAAFAIVGFMLSSDILLTPYQIARMYMMHGLEVMNPVRQVLVILLDDELKNNALKSIIVKTMGIDRSIDKLGVAWILFVADLLVFRVLALAVIWFAVWFDRRRIAKMHQ